MSSTQIAQNGRHSLLFVSGRDQFYRMNGVRVSTVIVSAKRAACVSRSLFCRLPICNRQIVHGSYFGV